MSNQPHQAAANDEPVVESYTPPLAKHKGLLALVVAMGLMIIFGLVALGITIMFMGVQEEGDEAVANDGGVVSNTEAPASNVTSSIMAQHNISLPEGAKVLSSDVDGGKLYVHYSVGDEHKIIEYDLKLGKISSKIDIKQ